MDPLRVPGTMASLSSVRAYVVKAAQMAALDDHAAYGLRLAVDEIATNVVVHGYMETGEPGELTLRARFEADQLTIVLQDTSPPYDPRQAPPPEDLDRDLQERPPGGLGIFLALRGVDAFHYEYANGVNTHKFTMNRNA